MLGTRLEAADSIATVSISMREGQLTMLDDG